MPPTEAVRLRGRVKDTRGPVAGARVLATTSVAGESLSALPCHEGIDLPLLECHNPHALFELVAQRAGEVPVLAQGTSASDGTFSLEVPRADHYTLWVESTEGVAIRHDVRAGEEELALELDPGARVSGVVRGEDEAPIPGALVTAIYTRHSRFFEALADGAGQFDLGTLPRGDYTLVVTRTGLSPTTFEFKAHAPRLRLEPVLTRPRDLSGVVLHEGRPVGDASVSVHCYRDALARSVRTDARGHFAFEGLPAQPHYTLEARHPGLMSSLEVDPQESADTLTVEMAPAVALRGVVRDPTGRPIPDAHVEAEVAPSDEEGNALGGSARTDEHGAYVLEDLVPAHYRVHAGAAGHLDSESQEVELTRGAREQDFTLAPATVLSGVLVDEDGQPVADESLQLTSPALAETLRTDSGQDGRFAFDVPRVGRYHLQVMGRTSQAQAPVEVTAPAELRLSVQRLPTLRGEVVDDTGLALSGVEVSLWPEAPGDAQRHLTYGHTNARGQFQLRAPAEGRYRLTAEFILGDITQTATTLVTVGPQGADTRLVLEKGHALSGVVVDSRGQPVEGAVVEVVSPLRAEVLRCGGPLGGKTGPDGRFSFQQVPDDAELKVSREGLVLACSGPPPGRRGVRLAPGTQDVRAVLVKKAVVRGKLIHADGSPVTVYTINGLARASPQGWFVQEFWCTGPLTLELSEIDSKPGAVPLKRTVSVEQEKDLDLGRLVLDGG
ncbi:carboxypeptidase regulatory-like domain-containing protein [Archangium primigenium]|uniref:carboxypeptidase regulatory-like domain-containing protein n=1 Tax=[Archangium] primigenium TaxID=2792470 RepID=UPI00195D79B0|nr:carboxypeptidase regulatory-like domain-containing protein [Archangium primigenium]